MRMEVPPAPFYSGGAFFAGYDIPLRVVHVESSPPFPPHGHDFHELVVVCAGRGRHIQDGLERDLRPGDVFLVPRGSSHEYVDPENLDYINILFDADALFDSADWPSGPDSFSERGFPGGSAQSFRLSVFGTREVVDVINRMDQELFRRKEGYAFMAKALFMQLWCLLTRKASERDDEVESTLERVRRMIRFLEREPATDVSVRDMANEAGTCVRNFHRIFRKIAGCAPLVYLNRLRVEKARELLRDTDKTVTQIAALVGYSDSNYFSRQFRHFTRRSPKQFRDGG